MAQKFSIVFHPELPKLPKKKNSFYKMWLIDPLYIKLGEKYYFTNTRGYMTAELIMMISRIGELAG